MELIDRAFQNISGAKIGHTDPCSQAHRLPDCVPKGREKQAKAAKRKALSALYPPTTTGTRLCDDHWMECV